MRPSHAPGPLVPTLAALLVAASALASERTLAPGRPITGTIDASAVEVTSPGLEAARADDAAPARGVAFILAPELAGPVTLTLRGWGFDGYLIVRDVAGEAIAEDDDGHYWAHSRVALADAAAARTVWAVARRGGAGEFELRATAGEAAPLGPDEERRLLEDDADRTLAALRGGAPADDVVLRSLASSLLDLEAPRRPAELLREVVRLRSARLGERHERVGVALNDLGLALSDDGEFEGARDTLLRALDVLTEALGEEHRNTLSTIGNLGTVERSLGELASAERLFARVVAAKERAEPPDPVALASARLNLAVVRLDRGELDAAASPLTEAADVFDAALGPEHGLTLIARSHLATLHQARERHDLALPLLDAILDAHRRRLGEENPQTALSRNNRAVCLRNLDRLDEARDEYERAIDVFERTVGPTHPRTLHTLGNLGQVLVRLADLARAARVLEEVADRCRARWGDDHPDTGMAMAAYAGVLRRLGRTDEEGRLLEDAVAILGRRLGPDHPSTLFALNELAIHRGNAGDDAGSLDLLRRVVRRRADRLGDDHPETLLARVNEAYALHREGESEAAIEILERCVDGFEARLGPDHPETLGALDTLVLVLHGVERYDEARAAALRSLDGTARRHLDRLAARTEEERLRTVSADASRLSWLLSQPVDADSLRAEHEAVLRWKGQVARSLRRDREALLDAADDATRREIERLSGRRRRLARATEERAIGDEEDVRRLRDEVDELERRLLARLDGSAGAARIGWRELRRAIPDDAAFIDLLVFDRHQVPEREEGAPPGTLSVVPSLMAYVVRPGTDRVMRRVVGRLDELEADVARLVGGVEAGRGRPALPDVVPSAPDAASALYRRLFEPYEELLEGVEHVIVSPDRFVGAVPFGALRDGEGRYLVERFRFSYVSDAGLLCELAATDRRDGRGGVLAVGDVDYGRGDDWAPLPGTSLELDDLARRFADVEILRGADATAAALRKHLPAARLAHLATHGFFVGRPRPATAEPRLRRGVHEALLEDAPPGARAGLVLAGGNDREADAILSADEVGWLALSGVDLVVLSACSTGLGTAFGGEGMQSLQRAFHVAGARTVVASLWKVDDAATADLMRAFYRARFDDGASAAEALRTARLELLERNRAAFGDARPATWGAFVLSGDWR